ncbi:MAG: hypothetical protein N3B21_19380 [Clostridia bacterium]|nr:hypothetical protein [Clostridia bacterium]
MFNLSITFKKGSNREEIKDLVVNGYEARVQGWFIYTLGVTTIMIPSEDIKEIKVFNLDDVKK